LPGRAKIRGVLNIDPRVHRPIDNPFYVDYLARNKRLTPHRIRNCHQRLTHYDFPYHERLTLWVLAVIHICEYDLAWIFPTYY